MIYHNDGLVYSNLTSKSVTVYGCSGSNCTTLSGNLCNLNTLNGCPYDNLCGQTAEGIGSAFTGQNEVGDQPAALVCCSDLGFYLSFSQGFLDEQDWSSFWCSDYDGNVCGNMPVNNYNRCQYLMFQYGPTEAGDYCDRIDLYLSGEYSSTTVASTCS